MSYRDWGKRKGMWAVGKRALTHSPQLYWILLETYRFRVVAALSRWFKAPPTCLISWGMEEVFPGSLACLSWETLPAPPGPPAGGEGAAATPREDWAQTPAWLPAAPGSFWRGCLSEQASGLTHRTQWGQKARGGKEGSYGSPGKTIPPPHWCIYQSLCR